MSEKQKGWSTKGGVDKVCNVCKCATYPRCLTCEQYGRKGNHPLDRDKEWNSHDNASYVKDDGSSQTSWNKKEEK